MAAVQRCRAGALRESLKQSPGTQAGTQARTKLARNLLITSGTQRGKARKRWPGWNRAGHVRAEVAGGRMSGDVRPLFLSSRFVFAIGMRVDRPAQPSWAAAPTKAHMKNGAEAPL
jgi:hypothetical protein